MTQQITKDVARRVLEVVDAGLSNGLGDPQPGQMCVEAAVCYALGEPHGDKPTCVARSVRAFKIALNDSAWSSNEARAKGMRRVAIAQLGSVEIDETKFAQILALETVRQLLPVTLRSAAEKIPAHSAALEAAAVLCEGAKTLSAACSAAYNAASAASAASTTKAAEIAVQALIACGTQGSKWLDLTEQT
jgi:hypothetical protein